MPEAPSPATPTEPAPTIGSTLLQIRRLARYQFFDYLRSRRFLLMMALVLILGGILSAVVGHFRGALVSTNTAFYGSFWGGAVTVVIVFAGVIFGADAIAGEFQNKTGYFLMGLPIRRVTVYVGKFIAAFAASLIAVVLFLVILILNGIYYFGSNAFPVALAASFGLAVIYLLALLGSTFMFSSLFKTSTYATLIVAVLFIFGFTILQELISDLVKIEPWFVISYASAIIGDVFDNPYPAHVVTNPATRFMPATTVYTPTIAEGIAIMLGYFVITAILGLFFFYREEFS